MWLYKLRVLKARIVASEDGDEALQLLSQDPPTKLAQTEIPALRKLTQAKVYLYRGDIGRAKALSKEAREIAIATSPRLLPAITFVQGYTAQQEKDTIAAEKYYREAVEFSRKEGDKTEERNALLNLGNILMMREQYDQAIAQLSPALQQSRSSPPDRLNEEFALGNLGWSYYELGDFDRATSFLEKAYALSKQTGRKAGEELWAVDLGNVYLSLENYEKSEGYYLKSYSLAMSSHDTATVALSLNNLAQLELARNNLQKAEGYNDESLAADQGIRNSKWRSRCMLTAAEIAILHKKYSTAEAILLDIANRSTESSLARRARSDLARLYLAEGKTAAAENEFQATVRIVETARTAIKQEERRMSILDAWPFYDDYIHYLIHQNNPRRALQIAEFSRSRTLAEGLGVVGPKTTAEVSIQRIQESLRGRGEIVVAYWLAKDESYLWVVTQSKVKSYVLKPQQEIEAAIRAYNAQLLNHEGIETLQDGQKLYEMLIRPAKKFVPEGSRVIVIPNRSLYKLNFETLVVPGTKPHYWIEDVTVEVAGSMALLASFGHSLPNAPKKLLLMGAPTQASNEFPQLIHASEEMQKVAAHFPETQEEVIPGSAATPDSYDSHHPNLFRFIHFVTHGTTSQTSPLDSAIILSPEADGSFKLYARDVVETHLNAELVTISACYGAGTRTYSGEGLVGLAWGFLRAGAHQVIAGLWEVDDRATPDLMDSLYDGLKRESAAAALRDAKLKMLHSGTIYRLPYYWGSLQLYIGS